VTADPVLALADLERWSFDGTALAVLGHPISHSLSPAMHNAALAALASSDRRFGRWRYFRFDVPPDDLARALGLLHARGFHGVNLTVPHKILAFPLVASADATAGDAGAVNTLLRAGAGPIPMDTGSRPGSDPPSAWTWPEFPSSSSGPEGPPAAPPSNASAGDAPVSGSPTGRPPGETRSSRTCGRSRARSRSGRIPSRPPRGPSSSMRPVRGSRSRTRPRSTSDPCPAPPRSTT
jgi:hypothetical protein